MQVALTYEIILEGSREVCLWRPCENMFIPCLLQYFLSVLSFQIPAWYSGLK